MTTETATSNMTSTNKRVRFSNKEDDAPKPATMTVLSPNGTAKAAVRTYAESLSRTLSPIILTAGEHFSDRVHKLISKATQLKKMEDDDEFIPRSARLVNFEFRVTKEVEASPDFVAIKEETTNLVSDFKIHLKMKIMETLRIEIALLKEKMYNNLAKDMDRVVVAPLTAYGQAPDAAHEIVSTVLHHHHDEYLTSTDLTLEEFYTIYKTVHSLDVFPIVPIPSQDDHDNVPMTTTLATTNLAPASPVVNRYSFNRPRTYDAMAAATTRAADEQRATAAPYKTVLFRTFMVPMKIYFERREEIRIENTLRRFHEETTLQDSTADTAARLGLEETASPELVEDLVRRLISEQSAKDKAQIGQLKKELASLKNSD